MKGVQGNKEEMSIGEGLRFLVELGQTDLSQISSDGLRKYLGVIGKVKLDMELRRTESHPDVLSEVVKVAGQIIEGLADRTKKLRLVYGAGEYLIDASGPHPLALEDSSLRDAVLHVASADIDSEQAARIRRCPRCK